MRYASKGINNEEQRMVGIPRIIAKRKCMKMNSSRSINFPLSISPISLINSISSVRIRGGPFAWMNRSIRIESL